MSKVMFLTVKPSLSASGPPRHLVGDRGVVAFDDDELTAGWYPDARPRRAPVQSSTIPVPGPSRPGVVLVGCGDDVADDARCVGRLPRVRPWRGTVRSRSSPPTVGSIAGVKACKMGACRWNSRGRASRTRWRRGHDVAHQRRRGHPKSADSRSSLPSGASSCQATSRGRGCPGCSVPSTLCCVPSRWRRKYSFALGRRAEQVRAPQHQVRGPVLGCVDIADRRCQRPSCNWRPPIPRGYPRRRRRPRRSPDRPPSAGWWRTADRTASSPTVPIARWRRRCADGPARPSRAGRPARSSSIRRCATDRCACTRTMSLDHRRGGRDQSRRLASWIQPGDRAALLLADVVAQPPPLRPMLPVRLSSARIAR